jgi:hypothetical protein
VNRGGSQNNHADWPNVALKGTASQAAEKLAREVLYQGTTSVVPLSRLFLMWRADFSPRAAGLFDFFRSLF